MFTMREKHLSCEVSYIMQKEHKAVEEEAMRLAKGVSIKCELHYRK